MAEGPVTTAIVKAWRTIQDGVWAGTNFATPEVAELKNLRKEGMPFSFRSNEFIIDLNEAGGVATIGEGDFEAEPTTTDLESGTLQLSQFNVRFDISKLAKYADQGNANQLERDMKYRAKKTVEAMGAHIGDYFYGSSSAILALADVNVTSATTVTLTLYAGYGNTSIIDGAFIARKFRPQVNGKGGDSIALINGSSLVASSFMRVTSRNLAAGTITCTVKSGNLTVNATGLKVVKANSKGNLTIAHTDFNRGLVGMQDILFSSSLHGLTHPTWTPAYTSSTAGRATFADLLLGDDNLSNDGVQDAIMNRMWVDQAVWRDMIAYERAGLRYANAGNLSLDGKLSAEGRKIFRSRRVPPGWMIGSNDQALYKWELETDTTDNPSWNDGKEYIDLSGLVFSKDRVLGLVTRNRKLFAVWTNKTRAIS